MSLQKIHGTEQLKDSANRFPVVDLGPELDTSNGAFMDTAAIMKNLDLVVTPIQPLPTFQAPWGSPFG